MNIACQRIHADMLHRGLMVQGFMPVSETPALADFFYWLLAKNEEEYHTSSSDIAAIASCLCKLSFQVLSVENFGGSHAETPCRLIYNEAPLYTAVAGNASVQSSHHGLRELSTMVSLTQIEETFSTFPIRTATANDCRLAWVLGQKAGQCIHLGPETTRTGLREAYEHDVPMVFQNRGSAVANRQPRVELGAWRLGSLLALFRTEELNKALSEVLERAQISEDTLSRIVDLVRSKDVGDDRTASAGPLVDSSIADAFTTCQAFFMGYYYEIFSTVVDISMLEIQTVSGCWGYRSVDLFREFYKVFHNTNSARGMHPPAPRNGDELLIARGDILGFVSKLYANSSVKLPKPVSGRSLSDQGLCVGVIGKRTILMGSLLRDCARPEDVCRFFVLDCDVGGIPRNPEGLVLTGIPSRFQTWEGETAKAHASVSLHGAEEDFTRHIEADWDYRMDHMRLCIRHKGRRIGTLNPVHADLMFCLGFLSPSGSGQPSTPIVTLGPMHTCSQDDFVISGRLVTPGRLDPNMPVVVQSKGNMCMRYAAAAWYAAQENCDVILVSNSLEEAYGEWKRGHNWSYNGVHDRFVVLIG